MYGPFYEQFVLENLQAKNKDIEFNRLNSDNNVLSCSSNYPYTPIFQVFKNGCKNRPFVYRSNKFTPEMLKDFI